LCFVFVPEFAANFSATFFVFLLLDPLKIRRNLFLFCFFCWIRRILRRMFFLFLLLNPLEVRWTKNPAKLVFVFFFVARSAGKSGGTCFCFSFVPGYA
jgi:hypothetical protein